MASVSASVVAPPSLSLALSNPTLCSQAFNGSKNTVTLSATGANTYTLYTPLQFGSAVINSSSTTLVPQAPFSSTLSINTITVEGSNGICSSFSTRTVAVKPNPVLILNVSSASICVGQSFSFSSSGAASYVWTGSTTNYSLVANGSAVITTPKNNAIFSVLGSSLGCNSTTQTSTLTVVPLPSLSLSAGSKSICLFENTTLSVTGNGTAYTWLPAQGITVYTGTAVVASPTVFQTYSVIASANSCTNTASISIGVWSLPQPRIEVYTPKVCSGSEIKLAAFGGTSYEWQGPSNFSASGQRLSFVASSFALSGTYSVTVIDSNSCKSFSTAVVEVLPLPEGGFNNLKEEFCSPTCTDFEFAGVDSSSSITGIWEINKRSFSASKFQYCFTVPGTYTLSGKFTDKRSGCSNTAIYTLIARPQPTADFEHVPLQPVEGIDEVVFKNTSKGEGLSSYDWYFNDNEGYSTISKDANFTYSQPGTYRIAMLVKNEWQCADTALKTINVLPDFSIYVPNSFTPNGDNLNDVFLPKLRSAKLYSIRIYDRWGKEVFYALDAETGWDGTFNGTPCKQEVYQWRIELSTSFGEKKILTGNVSLLR
jgi:gliding motility-associated-like protein